MKLLNFLRPLVSIFSRRSRAESEMEEELRSHILSRVDDLQRSGLTRANAERQARIEFGAYEHFKEEIREGLGTNFIETVWHDLLYAARLLRKSPAFTVVAILTLGLGIGANTAIFRVVNAVLLRHLPYTHPEQLVVVSESKLSEGVKETGCSYQDLLAFQDSGIFARVAAVQRHDLTLTGAGDPTVVVTAVVTPEIFSILDVQPLSGRYLVEEDQRKGSAPVVVLSEGLWRTRFGADSKLVGNTITLDQLPFTVVGIMPASFHIPILGSGQEIWIPLVHDPLFGPWMANRGGHWVRAVGRLKDGVSFSRSQSEVDSVGRKLAADFPEQNGGWAVRLTPLQDTVVKDVRTPLLILLGAVGLVLLLACVNLANLLLARATTRVREIALRQALGAKRSRIVRQLLTESALLGILGAGVGLTLAVVSSQVLALLLPPEIRGMHDLRMDGWVLGFALLVSILASIGFGLVPALLAADVNVKSSLQDSAARVGSGRAGLRLRSSLVAAEIGLAVVLVVAAGLLGRSVITMTAVDPGFQAAQLLKAQVSLPRYQYSKPEQWWTFCNEFLERLQSQPGMENSAIAVPLPIADGFVNLKFVIPDHAGLPPGTLTSADYGSVTPNYFHVMGIPVLRGRAFSHGDSSSSPRVAMISESFARLYFRDENAIGRRLIFGFPPNSDVTREIVGVVGNVRDVTLTQEPGPMMYVPFAQEPFWGANLVVRSSLPAAAIVGNIRQTAHAIDKDLPVTDIAAMPDVLNDAIAEPKFRTWLLSAFGLMALLLAAAGVFGVVSYSVAGRTREFGVRAALGATPGSIGKMVLMEGIGLGAIGLVIGAVLTSGLIRFLKSQLYGVQEYDPVTLVASALVLLAVALLACYIPARRAMRVDPMIALRYE